MPSGGAISTAAPASSTRSATRGPIISSPPTRSARLLPRLPSRDDRFPDGEGRTHRPCQAAELHIRRQGDDGIGGRYARLGPARQWRSEEHTSELPSLMRSSYAVFCLKNKKKQQSRE